MPRRDKSSTRAALLYVLLGLLIFALGIWAFRVKRGEEKAGFIVPTNALELLIEFEAAEAEKYWKPELLAQERGRAVEKIWDGINHAEKKLRELGSSLHAERIVIPQYDNLNQGPHDVEIFTGTRAKSLNGTAWQSLLASLESEGWGLERCEARFIGISPDIFYVSAHFTNEKLNERAIVEGNVVVEFGGGTNYFVRVVDASKLELRKRRGAPAFTEMFHAEVPPPAGSFFIDPLIVWDLDGDGQLEVILAAANVVFRREPNGRWTPDKLIESDLGLIFSGILGDFTGNGTADFLCVKFEGAALYEGNRDGRFSELARPVWSAQPRLKYGQSMSAGDVDGDGDLDLFLGQYKLPYDKGQMPFPYFDANDGFPSFLLVNDGEGNFSDKTQFLGLAAKRGRRVYSSSLVDLDSDRDLDLILVSDFAGLDAFENDGHGKFSDATRKWFDETHAFGMAHSLADFNADGWLDVLMIGMNSPTADRLASAGLNRPYDLRDEGMRAAVTFGNRLYFGSPKGSFRQSAVGAQVASTGWSWGSAAGDLDNDAFPDLYIANGHATGEFVHDYEPQFWLHDIYIGKSQENSLADAYFRQKFARRGGSGHSFGGYEKNRLFLNTSGTNFVEVAHLFGVAMEQDSRNVALQDLDRDGKLDLIVTTFEVYPKTQQTIRFFRNKLESVGRSAEVALTDPQRVGSVGRIVSSRTNAVAFVSGESYRTQLPHRAHIGLGTNLLSELRVESETNLFRIIPGSYNPPVRSAPLE